MQKIAPLATSMEPWLRLVAYRTPALGRLHVFETLLGCHAVKIPGAIWDIPKNPKTPYTPGAFQYWQEAFDMRKEGVQKDYSAWHVFCANLEP